MIPAKFQSNKFSRSGEKIDFNAFAILSTCSHRAVVSENKSFDWT